MRDICRMTLSYYISFLELLGLSLTIIGTICWGFCFYWMKQISNRQDKVLVILQSQTERIEKLAKVEHDLIKEVHPQVNDIKESLKKVEHDLIKEVHPKVNDIKDSLDSVAKVIDENIQGAPEEISVSAAPAHR